MGQFTHSYRIRIRKPTISDSRNEMLVMDLNDIMNLLCHMPPALEYRTYVRASCDFLDYTIPDDPFHRRTHSLTSLIVPIYIT